MKALLDGMDWQSFLFGVIFAFVFGYGSQKLRTRLKKMGDYFKPQKIVLFTKETPAQIGRGCSCSAVWIALFVILVVAIVAVALKNGWL